MVAHMPRVKIFIFISDPIKRLVSHFSMCKREFFSKCDKISSDDFAAHVTDFIATGSSKLPFIQEYVQYGNYGDIIDEVSDETESIHVVDGEMLKTNPRIEFGLLLDYFGLSLAPLEWRYNDSKGQYCLYRPVKFCLAENKGHQNMVHLGLLEEKLRQYYGEQMKRVFSRIYACDLACCIMQVERFSWMQPYFC